MKHDRGESEHKHLCITDTLKNAWPLKCHNSVKHFFFILVLRNFEDKLNFAFASLLKSGSTTVLSWERPPWWTCGLGAQRISPSALLCSVLPPTFPPSSFPSFPFFFPLANSQGCGHDRCKASLGLRQWRPHSGQLPHRPHPVPPGPVPKCGSRLARSIEPWELILFWVV